MLVSEKVVFKQLSLFLDFRRLTNIEACSKLRSLISVSQITFNSRCNHGLVDIRLLEAKHNLGGPLAPVFILVLLPFETQQ